MAMVLGLASGAGATLFVERFGTDLNVLEEQRVNLYSFSKYHAELQLHLTSCLSEPERATAWTHHE